MTNAPSNPPIVVQVLVSVDAQKTWTAHSLELLSDARALASRLNGAVGAWVLSSPAESGFDFNDLAVHGCRHAWHLKNPRFANWSSEAIAAALETHRAASCRLVVLPGTARGEEVASLLAEKLQTVWIADALTVSVTRTGLLEIAAVLPGGKLSRSFRMNADRVAVVTMRAGVAEIRREKTETIPVEDEEIDLSDVPSLTAVERSIPADPKTIDLTFANRVVSAGRGTGGTEGVALVSQLADALRASLGASRMAVDLGWAPQARQVGQTGRTVRPDLYVACGISGASHHLAGMRDSKHIVAINPDLSAPIHDVAHLSLPGDVHQVIPSIIAAVQKRAKGART